EKLVADAKADGKTTPAELALQIVKADKASGANLLAARLAADAAAGVAPVVLQTTVTLDAASDDETAKAEWDKDAKLRAEFGGKFDTYLAYAKATKSGRAKILTRG
ncbi:hypothetical protein, partial [Pseudorhodobacter sp.]|uniref:hypothetical protein n=1 Tax=Pseudorhodobacter sp. TaxID=1934400 RepID=UPI002647B4CD